jgi:hypothetical protein
MKWAIIIVALGLALAGGYWWRRPPAHPPPVEAFLYETDMNESLIRHILAEMEPPLPSVCFLAFGEGGTPPSREFIARFAGTQPAMRSYQSASGPPTGQFFETSTGKPGLLVHIVRFKEVAPETFEVLVQFSNLPAGHDQVLYRLAQVDNAWVVQGSHPG